jgi:predicted nuclease with TOPRIM domain
VVELRLEVLEKQSEKTKVNEDLKRLSKENKSLKQANEKLIGEINAVTRKLINYKTDWKKTITSKLNQNKEALHRMR